ncbi:Macrophomate synthase [Achaetomium macrosporum]|uniref:Macrophomate synthase n=1 Tax=Achaetomium macrosporum TaxID=79813 RepID=A0AAN7H403_9PEZI|nr:Macrophomate synthase [Achaetomium macrosporum]
MSGNICPAFHNQGSPADEPGDGTRAGDRERTLDDPAADSPALVAATAPVWTRVSVAQGVPSVFVTKVLASTKPDFIWMDVEHGMFDRLTLFDAIHAVQHHSEGKSLVLVRVSKHDETALSTALDAGAAGIIIPHCESAQEVKDKIKEAFHPPLGERSFSPWTFTPGISDASLYPNDAFNIQTSNRHICIILQVESVKGIENTEEIAAVEGVSGLMFGPGDFSIDAGLELKLGGEPHPTFMTAMQRFVAAGKKYGKPLAGAAQVPQMIPMMIQQGYGAIAVVFDYWALANMVHSGLKEAKGILDNAAASESKTENGDAANGSAKA